MPYHPSCSYVKSINSWGWKKTNKVGRVVCFFHPPSSAESQKIKQQENKYERKTKQDRLYKEEKCFTRDSNTRQASSQRINFFPSPLHFHFTPVTHTTTWVDPRFDAERHALYCSFIHRFDTDHFHASCATLAQYRKHFTVGFPKVPPLSTEKKLSMSFTLDSLLYLLVQSWILSGRINFDYMAVGLRHCAERLLHPNTRDRLRSAERRSIWREVLFNRISCRLLILEETSEGLNLNWKKNKKNKKNN